jgi:murein DD-endopeptidase MepM/ murein hydrolase activator NlpD
MRETLTGRDRSECASRPTVPDVRLSPRARWAAISSIVAIALAAAAGAQVPSAEQVSGLGEPAGPTAPAESVVEVPTGPTGEGLPAPASVIEVPPSSLPPSPSAELEQPQPVIPGIPGVETTAGGAEAAPPPHEPAPRQIVRAIRFPVAGPARFQPDFGDPRDGHTHAGNDIVGSKLQTLVAAVDGTVVSATLARSRPTETGGGGIVIRDADGFEYVYLHLNNDRPGSDDDAGPDDLQIRPGIVPGRDVTAGEPIGFLGDSGNAESAVPHVHFEIRDPDGNAVDPYPSLIGADHAAPEPVLCPVEPAPINSTDGSWTVRSWSRARPMAAFVPAPHRGGSWEIDVLGVIVTHGEAPSMARLTTQELTAPIVGGASTPDGLGLWVLLADGSVVTRGTAVALTPWRPRAPGLGVAAGQPDRVTYRAIASVADGWGYWLLRSDGRVDAYGVATDLGDVALTATVDLDGSVTTEGVVGLASTASGRGFGVLTDRGRWVPFGDARLAIDPVPTETETETETDRTALWCRALGTAVSVHVAANTSTLWLLDAAGTARALGDRGTELTNAAAWHLVPARATPTVTGSEPSGEPAFD